MSDAASDIRLDPDEIEIIYDALRFARDEFTDENGLEWSNEEYSRLQGVIDRLERVLPVQRG